MTAIAIGRSIGPVPIDVVVTETHESALTITRLPVEKGTDITDHAYLEPKKVKLDGAVGAFTAPGLAAGSPLGGRVLATFEALLRLQATREPFDLVTGLKVYKSMLIENMSVSREARTANILSFSASCAEIKIVSTSSATGDQNGSNPAGGEATDKGQKTDTTGQSEPKPTAAPLQSAMHSQLYGPATFSTPTNNFGPR